MTDRKTQDDKVTREAQRDLERITASSEVLGTSALRRAAEHTKDHFAARDAQGPDGTDDWAELWGRRIGRGLSLVGVVVLIIYLWVTYF